MRLPSGVGWTSFIAAYARAAETRRAHPRFSDHWAGRFLAAFREQSGVRVGPAAGSEIWAFFDAYVSGRTPFYDAHLRSTVAAGCRQVVLLGAGLDTRALRLDIPHDVAARDHRPLRPALHPRRPDPGPAGQTQPGRDRHLATDRRALTVVKLNCGRQRSAAIVVA